MKTLVTGATGFVGAAVVRTLLKKEQSVRVLVRQNSDRSNLKGLPVEPVVGDLTDHESLKKAVAGCRALFHVAADYRLWVPDPYLMDARNVSGTQALMLAAADAGVDKIVYTSSVATLGVPGNGSKGDEQSPVTINDMIGHYKRSKFKAEAEVTRLFQERRLPVVIVNPSTPVGPGDIKPTPTGRMVVDAAAGRMPAYVDTGLNVVHVDDVAKGHWLALQNGQPGRRYVLGGDNCTLQQILTIIARIAGRRPPKVKLPRTALMPLGHAVEAWARWRGKGEPLLTVDGLKMSKKKMFFSSARARRELGYASRPAEQALEDAVHWFRDKGYF